MSRIVVGVDSSEHGTRALRWAVAEARLRDSSLEVLHSVAPDDLPAYPVVRPRPQDSELKEAGDRLLAEAVEKVDVGDVEVTTTAVVGPPAERLCEAARGADLLVMGARGLGGFKGLLLGSATQQAVSHAPCPVVVVVPEDQ